MRDGDQDLGRAEDRLVRGRRKDVGPCASAERNGSMAKRARSGRIGERRKNGENGAPHRATSPPSALRHPGPGPAPRDASGSSRPGTRAPRRTLLPYGVVEEPGSALLHLRLGDDLLRQVAGLLVRPLRSSSTASWRRRRGSVLYRSSPLRRASPPRPSSQIDQGPGQLLIGQGHDPRSGAVADQLFQGPCAPRAGPASRRLRQRPRRSRALVVGRLCLAGRRRRRMAPS